MPSTVEEDAILQKTKELCQVILDQPAMKSIRQRIDAFLGDASTRTDYEALVNKGQSLQEKQQTAVALTGEEISDFEQHRDRLLQNRVARDYLDAQEELRQVQQSVHQYVNKTLELWRLPTEDEMSCGSCGGGCSCH